MLISGCLALKTVCSERELCKYSESIFALLRPASAPLAAKIRTAYLEINTAGSNVNLMKP